MTYFLTFSCVIGGWAMLRMMGTERTEMMRELEMRLRQEQQTASPPPPPAKPAAKSAGKPHAADATPASKPKH
jgi:hypothetical protein